MGGGIPRHPIGTLVYGAPHTPELKVPICNKNVYRADQSWGRLATCSLIIQHHPTSIQHPSNIHPTSHPTSPIFFSKTIKTLLTVRLLCRCPFIKYHLIVLKASWRQRSLTVNSVLIAFKKKMGDVRCDVGWMLDGCWMDVGWMLDGHG